jgi:hypothetical protein
LKPTLAFAKRQHHSEFAAEEIVLMTQVVAVVLVCIACLALEALESEL